MYLYFDDIFLIEPHENLRGTSHNFLLPFFTTVYEIQFWTIFQAIFCPAVKCRYFLCIPNADRDSGLKLNADPDPQPCFIHKIQSVSFFFLHELRWEKILYKFYLASHCPPNFNSPIFSQIFISVPWKSHQDPFSHFFYFLVIGHRESWCM